VRVGVDLIEIERIRRALQRHGDGFRFRCFTEHEVAYCESKANPAQHYAGRFAAKEAVGKALGSGVHFTWTEIEIRGRPKPGVHLSGRTARWAEKVGAGRIELSMTHSRELAAARGARVGPAARMSAARPRGAGAPAPGDRLVPVRVRAASGEARRR
jgi:holo-[acyl-carrier protein] synthase